MFISGKCSSSSILEQGTPIITPPPFSLFSKKPFWPLLSFFFFWQDVPQLPNNIQLNKSSPPHSRTARLRLPQTAVCHNKSTKMSKHEPSRSKHKLSTTQSHPKAPGRGCLLYVFIFFFSFRGAHPYLGCRRRALRGFGRVEASFLLLFSVDIFLCLGSKKKYIFLRERCSRL